MMTLRHAFGIFKDNDAAALTDKALAEARVMLLQAEDREEAAKLYTQTLRNRIERLEASKAELDTRKAVTQGLPVPPRTLNVNTLIKQAASKTAQPA